MMNSGENDPKKRLSPEEEQADETVSANLELDEEFGDTEAETTRLEDIAREEGERIEEHDHTSERDAETKADDIIDDAIMRGGGYGVRSLVVSRASHRMNR
jgi:hypothetical protein